MTKAVQPPASPKSLLLDPTEPGISATYVKGPAFRRYLTTYTLSTIAFTAVWGSVLGILLPNHVQILELPNFFTGNDAGVDLQSLTLLRQAVDNGTATPTAAQSRLLGILADYDSARAQSLALITSIGVAVTMLVQPVIGVVSDRTRSRLGRRAPWILFGVLVGAAALAGMRFAPTIAVLGLLFVIAQALLNVAQAPLVATVADRVQEQRRGMASSLGGFGNFFGGTAGGVGAGFLFSTLGLEIYFLIAAFVALAAVLFVVVAKDRSSLELAVPKHSWREFFVGFTIAVRARDFRWVWVARILLAFGYTVSTAMSLYMLQSYVRPALSAAEATSTAPLLNIAGLVVTLASVLVAGRISDKLGRRKSFVVVASLLMAGSMVIPIVSPTLPGLFAQVMVAGLAYGVYLPVDQALFIDVLPNPRSAGRDLGVASLGTNLGQALGPILASIVVSVTGGYLGVWGASLVLVALAAVAITPVRAR